MSGDRFGGHNWGEKDAMASTEATEAAKYCTIHRMGPYNKELSSPKCQTIEMRNIHLRFSILAKC